MDGLYVIWSGSKQGWLTATATYSSELADARHYTRDDAIRSCRSHWDTRSGTFDWLPVYIKDLEAMETRR